MEKYFEKNIEKCVENVEEKEENVNVKKEKIGIKVPWWIGYTILIIVFVLSDFLVYKAFNPNAITTFAQIYNKELIIQCDKTEIGVGKTISIDINEDKDGVILQSSNPDIINIEDKNNIIGVSEGETTIFATYKDKKSNEINLKCIVDLEQVTLNKTEIELTLGTKEELIATLVPENVTYKDLTWKSSNEEIATVENGIVTGIKEGKTTITVSSLDETKIANCFVTVKPIEVTNVSLDETSVKLGVGQKYILMCTVSPDNATNKSIIWESSNKGILTINNGMINAVSSGNATVTVVSSNGKTSTCNFYISSIAPSNTTKYATTTFNIRSGPGTNYKILGSVSKNDEIEILQYKKDYAKVRMSNGVVGYTTIKSYSSSKSYYIDGVPYINQFNLGYPTGCEAVSATMAAKYAGYNVGVSTIVANTPTDTLGKRQEIRTTEIATEVLNEETGEMEEKIETQEETIWVGGNPFNVFVGHPTKGISTGSYGCFAAPIVVSLKASGVSCTNISGCSFETMLSYIAQGKPVIVWCRKNALDLTEGVRWEYPDGSGNFLELVGEHCAVLIGYDGDYVYLNDPSFGKGVKQPRGKFISNWNKLYNQAIIIN